MIGQTEYMCIYCGERRRLSNTAGRPSPGFCPRRRKAADGRPQPHRWVINKKG